MSAAPNLTTPVPLPPAPKKSPGVAVIFSLIPGLGHVYLGLYQRGLGFFALFLLASWFEGEADLSNLIPVFFYVWPAVDAYQMATAPSLPPVPGVSQRKNLGLGIALMVGGVLAFLYQIHLLDFSFLADWWPVGLIGLGAWLAWLDLKERKQKRPPLEEDPEESR